MNLRRNCTIVDKLFKFFVCLIFVDVNYEKLFLLITPAQIKSSIATEERIIFHRTSNEHSFARLNFPIEGFAHDMFTFKYLRQDV